MQFIYFVMFRATWFVIDDQVTSADALVLVILRLTSTRVNKRTACWNPPKWMHTMLLHVHTVPRALGHPLMPKCINCPVGTH